MVSAPKICAGTSFDNIDSEGPCTIAGLVEPDHPLLFAKRLYASSMTDESNGKSCVQQCPKACETVNVMIAKLITLIPEAVRTVLFVPSLKIICKNNIGNSVHVTSSISEMSLSSQVIHNIYLFSINRERMLYKDLRLFNSSSLIFVALTKQKSTR